MTWNIPYTDLLNIKDTVQGFTTRLCKITDPVLFIEKHLSIIPKTVLLFDKLFGKKEKLDRQALGKLGEQYGVNHLKKKNYQILKTNYQSRFGEIDIIARKENTIVFVEVKTREEHLPFGLPREAVNRIKQNRIRKIADGYLAGDKKGDWKESRFDIVEVIVQGNGKLKSLNHITDAF